MKRKQGLKSLNQLRKMLQLRQMLKVQWLLQVQRMFYQRSEEEKGLEKSPTIRETNISKEVVKRLQRNKK